MNTIFTLYLHIMIMKCMLLILMLLVALCIATQYQVLTVSIYDAGKGFTDILLFKTALASHLCEMCNLHNKSRYLTVLI